MFFNVTVILLPNTKQTKIRENKMVKKVIKKKKIKKVPNKIKVLTPPGTLSYPHLASPDEGKTNSDGKYKTDLLIKKADWKEKGKELRQAVLKVGRRHFGDENLQLKDFANPFKDTDALENYSENDRTKGCILLRAKTEYVPSVIGPDKEELSEEDIAKIKGGDTARLVVEVYPYDNDEGGVTVGLNLVQFIQTGKALGQGNAAALALVDEIDPDDMDIDDPDTDDEDEDEDKPVSRKAKKGQSKTTKKPVKKTDDEEDEEEELDGDSEEEDSDELAPPRKKKKSKAPVDEDEEEEDEEEEAPKKKSKVVAKKKSSKKSDDDEEEEEFEFEDEDEE